MDLEEETGGKRDAKDSITSWAGPRMSANQSGNRSLHAAGGRGSRTRDSAELRHLVALAYALGRSANDGHRQLRSRRRTSVGDQPVADGLQ